MSSCDSSGLPNRAGLEKLARQAEFISNIGTGPLLSYTNPDTGVINTSIPGWEQKFSDTQDSWNATFGAQFSYKYIKSFADANTAGEKITEATKLNAYSTGTAPNLEWYGLIQSTVIPVGGLDIPAAPDDNWVLVDAVNINLMRTDSASQLDGVYEKDYETGDVIPSDAMKDRLMYWNSGQFYSVGTDTGFTSNDFDADLAAGLFAKEEIVKSVDKKTKIANSVFYKSKNGAYTAIRTDILEWSDDVATRVYIEPSKNAVETEADTGGCLKIFSVPYTDGGLPYYQDFGLYYNRKQNEDEGYYKKGVFYLNSKAYGINNADIAVTFQDGRYQAFKSTLLPAASAGGNRAVTVFGKRNSTTAGQLAGCHMEYSGWLGFDAGNSGLAWWGANGGFSSKMNVHTTDDGDTLSISLNNVNALRLSSQKFEIKDAGGNVKFGLDLSGLDQGALFNTRIVGRFTTVAVTAFSVAGINTVKLDYATLSYLSELRDGVNGQHVTIISNNTANVNIQNNDTIKTKSGSDIAMSANSAIQFVSCGGLWLEI